MIRWFGRWLLRIVLLAVGLALALLAPVVYVELMCQPEGPPDVRASLLPPESHRSESRTLLTYPEWHIVHAYDDYAQVIATGDPHDYAYGRAIAQYWSSLCSLSRASGQMDDVDTSTKQMVYVIGVSFTAELAMKALYEETLGRLFTVLRGPEHSALDVLSAGQARNYAAFLQQVPWYRWDFEADIRALDTAKTDLLRDRERRLALGGEFSVKAAYARLIAQAVAATGFDELKLRMVVKGLDQAALSEFEGVKVIGPMGDGYEIETPRYRALTRLLEKLAIAGAEFVEIAGNDDIMFTVTTRLPGIDGALASLPRQGYGDTRYLVLVKVTELATRLRAFPGGVEHIHDY